MEMWSPRQNLQQGDKRNVLKYEHGGNWKVKTSRKSVDAPPHFHALGQGKQTAPCSAGTWAAVPPLLWLISRCERRGVSFG